MANPDDKGLAKLVADIDGEAIKIRIDDGYLAQSPYRLAGVW